MTRAVSIVLLAVPLVVPALSQASTDLFLRETVASWSGPALYDCGIYYRLAPALGVGEVSATSWWNAYYAPPAPFTVGSGISPPVACWLSDPLASDVGAPSLPTMAVYGYEISGSAKTSFVFELIKVSQSGTTLICQSIPGGTDWTSSDTP